MGIKLRFRKSLKIAPGVKVNLSQSGISGRIGGKAAGVSVGKRGARLSGSVGPAQYSQKLGGTKSAAPKRRRWWLLWLA